MRDGRQVGYLAPSPAVRRVQVVAAVSAAVYEGAVFEQARPTVGFPLVRYTVAARARRAGWWTCTMSHGGSRDIPGRALLNPGCYRQVT